MMVAYFMCQLGKKTYADVQNYEINNNKILTYLINVSVESEQQEQTWKLTAFNDSHHHHSEKRM